MTLRQFTYFHCQRVPKHHAFHLDFNRLTPDTLKAINHLIVQAAVDLELEDGSKPRVDTMVVETDIHHPTDNTLLWDVVRVVTRLVGQLAKALERRDKHLREMAGTFSRRLHAFCSKQGLPIIEAGSGQRKHELAEPHVPKDPTLTGLFLVITAASARW